MYSKQTIKKKQTPGLAVSYRDLVDLCHETRVLLG